MSITIQSIRGAASLADFQPPKTEEMITVIAALDSANDLQVFAALDGVDAFAGQIGTIDGIEGSRVETETLKVGWNEKGLTRNTAGFQTTKDYFTLTRKGFQAKNFSFDLDMKRSAKERNISLDKLVMDTTTALTNSYTRTYLPNMVYYALIRGSTMNTAIPVANGTYYGTTDVASGAVRGVNVTNVKPGKDGSAANHFLVKKGATITSDDMQRAIAQMTIYKGTKRKIVCYGSKNSIWSIRVITNYADNKDIWERTGAPAWDIAGCTVIENEYIPDGFLLFVDAKAPELITKLQSPAPEYRGLGIYKANGFDSFEVPDDLAGSVFEIFPESYNVLNRTGLLWLDITNTDAGGLMQTAGFTALEAYADQLLEDITLGL